jgi:hypothetical protein
MSIVQHIYWSNTLTGLGGIRRHQPTHPLHRMIHPMPSVVLRKRESGGERKRKTLSFFGLRLGLDSFAAVFRFFEAAGAFRLALVGDDDTTNGKYSASSSSIMVFSCSKCQLTTTYQLILYLNVQVFDCGNVDDV